MFGPTVSYNQTIRKYNDIFGSLFTNIKIERLNVTNTKTQFQKVPIEFAPKFRYIAREEQDPDIEKPVSVQLPRMSYELLDLSYDAERQLNPIQKMVQFQNGVPTIRFVPIPYKYVYKLYVYTKFLEDQYQIAEQILPYFSPKLSLSAELVEGSCSMGVDITIGNVEMSDEFEGSFTGKNRQIIWSYTFTIPGWIMTPDDGGTNSGKIIRWVRNSIGDRVGAPIETSNTYPVLAGTDLEDIEPTDPYTVQTEMIIT